MARPRNPLGKAKVEGRDKMNAGRFKNRKEPSVDEGIGAPPTWMNANQRKVWALFCRELPWLNGSHRALLEIAVSLRTRLVSGDEVGVQALGLLKQCLGAMGATPADATKVTVPNEEDDEEDGLD
ncbi:hypothetical protein [Sinorhizobium meliloti]|uniref:hypothetical protein n=1 Tax=Rhizobium meliloti TaxID=382 RepID=UPI0018E88993|nr:hypothetical protein [Sinorhizobium meliloti]QQF02901.1 hypothetical protein JFX10_16475 [Sinorhizobium meliloti]